jgi:hypothetical protein
MKLSATEIAAMDLSMVCVIASQACQRRNHRARARGDGRHYLPHVASLALTGFAK